MQRREFLRVGMGAGAIGWMLDGAALSSSSEVIASSPSVPGPKQWEWDEATITQLQDAMARGSASAVSITKAYLGRIHDLDRNGPKVNSVIELNPDALAIARALDRERKDKGPRGPMHGIPVLIKDNIDTHDRMMTTAGSLALLGSIPAEDAFVVRKLREAGAVILGKTNLSEWANLRSSRSTSGWSARGGLTHNPYVLDRNTSGSSAGSGAAVAANFCVVAIGTETDGSIVSPSSVCGIVGVKPTVGLISRSGVIPISHTQDTTGPMARTVRDAAILLGVLAGEDLKDAATQDKLRPVPLNYARFLEADGLRGARIGVARQYFKLPNPSARRLMDATVEAIKGLGAILVDPVKIPSADETDGAEFEVLLYEFKADLNRYLAGVGTNIQSRTLKDLIEFNEKNREKEMPYFGQEDFLAAQEKSPLTDKAYVDALEKCRRLSRTEGIDAVMSEHQLDAIIAPTAGPAHRTDLVYGDRDIGGSSSLAATAGYPSITVPCGYVDGLPVGVSFFGRAYAEPVLLKLAYSFEQGTKARKRPQFLPTVGEM